MLIMEQNQSTLEEQHPLLLEPALVDNRTLNVSVPEELYQIPVNLATLTILSSILTVPNILGNLVGHILKNRKIEYWQLRGRAWGLTLL